MKKPPTPAIGDIWVKGAYKTVGWPAGRVTITDVVTIKNKTWVNFNFLAGTEAGKSKVMELRTFQRMFLFARAHTAEPLQPDLEMAEYAEAYRGETEDPS
jgi:hypothetical protein